MSTLESEIQALWNRYDDGLTAADATADDLATLDVFLEELEAGNVRSAEKTGDDVTSWEANAWVKQGILLNFGLRHTEARSHGGVDYHDVLPLRQTADLNDRGTRNTPDGTTIRRGAYLGEDGVSLGAGCRVTSGFKIGENSVVGENTLLTPRIPVYDLVEEEVIYGHLPSERRAFTRYVESSVSDHEMFDGGAYKPAVVATGVEEETLEATQREYALRE